MRKRLVLSSYGVFLGVKGERLVVRKKGETLREIPAFEVSQVLIDTRGATVSSAAMRLLLRHGIELLILGGGKLMGKLSPARRGANIRLRMTQYSIINLERGSNLARAFIMGKLRNQSDLLKSLAKNREGDERKRMRKTARQIDNLMWSLNEIRGPPEVLKGRIMRVEAEAGRIYWSAIASILPKSLEFRIRKQRFDRPQDPFNTTLNYLYTILMSEAWFALESTGLEPYLGFLHVPNNRRPALAVDFMEEFRQPVVDRAALSLVKDMDDFLEEGKLKPDGRKKALKAYEDRMNALVTFRGRRHRIRGHLRLQAERLASAIMGRSTYEPFRVKW